MREATGDMFDKRPRSALVITTNGFVKASGENVMGRGCAAQAAKKYPQLPNALGYVLGKAGNHVHHFKMEDGEHLVTFPVKPVEVLYVTPEQVVRHMRNRIHPGTLAPGWAAVADPDIIERSADELVELVNDRGWEDVVLPRPGCGAGELSWTDIKPMLERVLDDRFIIMNFT